MTLRALLLGLGLFLTLCIPALGSAQTPNNTLPSFGPLLLQVAISLLIVCALAYLAIRFGLTRLQPRAKPNARLEMVETLPVGARRSIVMLRAQDRILVIGVTEAGMTLLSDLGPDSATAPPEEFKTALEEAHRNEASSTDDP